MGLLDIFGQGKPAPIAQAPIPSAPVGDSKAEDKKRMEMLETYLADIRVSVGKEGSSFEEAFKSTQRAPSPTLTYQKPTVIRRDERAGVNGFNFERPVHNLAEVAVARDTESLINTSAEKHVEILLKSGFSIDGPKAIAEHVRYRILEIELNSQVTMFSLISQLADQISTYGTGMVCVSRNKDRASGKRIKLWGKDLAPISAWNVPDTCTMSSAENEGGKVIKWKQTIQNFGKEKLFDASDVFVFTRHKQAGRVFGRSMYLPSLDDAMMLRGLEDLANIVSQKYAFPFTHYIVGTEEAPAGDVVIDGERISEVSLAQETIKEMEPEAVLVTSERHKITLIGTEGKALDLTKYMEHFKARLQESTRMSNTALGTGGAEQSKSVGQTQMKNLEDSCRYLQQVISDGFFWIFLNLVGDGGFDITLDNMVVLDFSNADSEEIRAQENHVLAQYQGDLINEDEARKELGRNPMTQEGRKKTFSAKNMENDLRLTKAKAAAKPAPGGKKSGSKTKKKAKASKKSTTSKSRPTNQTGTKTAKRKIKKNDSLELFTSEVNNLIVSYTSMSEQDIQDQISVIYSSIEGSIKAGTLKGIMKASLKGIQDIHTERVMEQVELIVKEHLLDFFNKKADDAALYIVDREKDKADLISFAEDIETISRRCSYKIAILDKHIALNKYLRDIIVSDSIIIGE